MFWNYFLTKTSDAKIIEQARKNLRSFERWGYWLNVFYLSVPICFAVLLIFVGKIIIQLFLNLGPGNRIDYMTGFVVGLLVGTMLHKFSHWLLQYSFSQISFRRDRLLVQYHDALIDCLHAMPDSDSARQQEKLIA